MRPPALRGRRLKSRCPLPLSELERRFLTSIIILHLVNYNSGTAWRLGTPADLALSAALVRARDRLVDRRQIGRRWREVVVAFRRRDRAQQDFVQVPAQADGDDPDPLRLRDIR